MSWEYFERYAFTHHDNYENEHLDAYSIFYGNIYKDCNRHNWTLANAYANGDEYGDRHVDSDAISCNHSYTDCYWNKHPRSLANGDEYGDRHIDSDSISYNCSYTDCYWDKHHQSLADGDEYTPGYTQQFRHIYKHFVANGFTHFIGQ